MKRYHLIIRNTVTCNASMQDFDLFIDAYRAYKNLYPNPYSQWPTWDIRLVDNATGHTLAHAHIGCKHDKAFRRIIHA